MEGGGGSGRRSISLDVRSMVQVPVRDGFNAFEKRGGGGMKFAKGNVAKFQCRKFDVGRSKGGMFDYLPFCLRIFFIKYVY